MIWLIPANPAATLSGMDWLPYILIGTGVVVSFAGVMRWMLRDVRADLGGRIDRPERHVDRVDARMDRLETRMDGRMDRLETRLDSLAADLRTVSDRLARIEGAAGGPWPGRTPPPRPLRSQPSRRTISA